MKTIHIEIRAAEGGNDSKLLVQDMSTIYQKCALKNGFDFKVIQDNPGIKIL